MKSNRWHMNRMGLVDFWCYENEVFEFDDGHILLRGTNGSGKSVTLQSFIPLLLDGNKSSERLDTFGSTSRKMDTYLIDENSDREERIGYLYLEFKKENLPIFVTVGMGLKAKKNKPLQSWYFVIEDNRRVGIDFKLMENQLTLSMRQLKNILGDQVIEKQTEYMKKVNDVLFGFESIEDYKEALNLLLQLRMPKLSNSLSPDKLNDLLSRSLRPLSEDDLRPMSEAMQNMDNLQDELDTLKQSYVAATTICNAYTIYNEVMLLDKWQKHLEQAQFCKQYQKELEDIQEKTKVLKLESQQLEEDLKQNQIQTEILTQEKLSLLSQDMERLHEEMVILEKEILSSKNELNRKNEILDLKENRLDDLKNEIKKNESQRDQYQRHYQKSMKELSGIYEEFPFSEHVALKDAVDKQKIFEFSYTKQALRHELIKVNEGLDQWTQHNQISNQKQYYEDELAKTENDLDIQNSVLKQAEDTYENMVKEYQESFYHFSQNNQILKLTNQHLQQMVETLVAYEQKEDYLPIIKLVQSVYFDLFSSQKAELIDFYNQLSELKQQAQMMLDEISYWKRRKEIEPERDEIVKENREQLSSLGVSYIPFYKLLEFDENMTQEEKNTIESMLSQMHLLDAIVVSQDNQQQIINLNKGGKDFYLWTSLSIEDLSTVELKGDNFFEILDRLGITNKKDVTYTSQYFESGIIYGTYSSLNEATYIGYQSREALRLRKIEILENEYEAIEKKIQIVETQINLINESLALLDNELHSFRTEDDLKAAFKMVVDEKNRYEKLCFDKLHLEAQIKEHEEKIILIRREINVIAQALLIGLSEISFRHRRSCIEDYETELDNLKSNYESYLHLNDLLLTKQNRYDEMVDDLDDLRYEIETFESRISVQQGKRENISRQLEAMGYNDIQLRLQELEKELKLLSQNNEVYHKKQGSYESELKQVVIDERNMQDTLEKQIRIEQMYLDIFNQELDYQLVLPTNLSESQITKEMKMIASKNISKKSLQEYQTNLQRIFFEQNPYLTQYRPTHELDAIIHPIEGMDGRLILKAIHMGKSIPFNELKKHLEENIEAQKLLLAEEDRKIFEDILVNTISKKIRYHIHSSRRWVDKMERYMQSMNTSSGLQLSLKWRSKKSNIDGELDISELVDLLDKDYHLLKESDRKKISTHFRSKIEYAREMSLDENTTKSFHQLIKEVMDYREWFDFTIYAKKPNENKKELTRKIFGAYSGGEKAIVMLVPLFSAVTAKMESARDDAPLLIALDEAFAGVDENNIDSLFALIGKFNFDYIMNSQVLWGDYPSCKSLAIYELFRPNNAPYVTTVAYHWNGHQRTVRINEY